MTETTEAELSLAFDRQTQVLAAVLERELAPIIEQLDRQQAILEVHSAKLNKVSTFLSLTR